MLPILEKLLILQERDRKLLRLKAELSAVGPQREYLQGKVAKATAEFETVRQRSKQLESDRKRLELEVASKVDFIRKCETQQGATKKNEEYKAFQHQIDTTKTEISALEDQQLALMERAEVVGKEVAEAEKIAKALKAELDKQLAELAAREATLKTELQAAIAARAAQVSEIDPAVVPRYERLLKTKGDNIVVGMPHGTCGGCHMQLPTHVFNAAKAEQEITQCINCGRILYYSREMEG